MTVNLGKVALTTGSIMNMHGIKIAGPLLVYIGKAENFRFHQYAVIRGLVKFYKPAESGIFSTAVNPCDGIRAFIRQ